MAPSRRHAAADTEGWRTVPKREQKFKMAENWNKQRQKRQPYCVCSKEGCKGWREAWKLTPTELRCNRCRSLFKKDEYLPKHLHEHWHDGKLPLRGGSTACYGYSTYGKTLSAHDARQQAENTLLMTNTLLPLIRDELPGFGEMEQFLVAWLHETYGVVVELYFAHALRQSTLTVRSTGFDVHQDTEDFPFIEFTVVVKLTPDAPGSPHSRMRLVGAPRQTMLFGARQKQAWRGRRRRRLLSSLAAVRPRGAHWWMTMASSTRAPRGAHRP